MSEHSKNSILEYVVSISALITAVVAVIIAVVELRTNREYQRLSVEPYFELANHNISEYQFRLINSGLGPGRVERVLATVDGDRVNNWSETVSKLTEIKDTRIITSDLWNGRQLKAGEEVSLLTLSDKVIGRSFHKNFNRVKFSVCYCSIYKECWIKHTEKAPRYVESCPVDWAKSF